MFDTDNFQTLFSGISEKRSVVFLSNIKKLIKLYLRDASFL